MSAPHYNRVMSHRAEPLIYLAYLGHNQLTVSSDVYPLGVANLAAYAREHVKGSKTLRIHIFREPQELKTQIDAETPNGTTSFRSGTDARPRPRQVVAVHILKTVYC